MTRKQKGCLFALLMSLSFFSSSANAQLENLLQALSPDSAVVLHGSPIGTTPFYDIEFLTLVASIDSIMASLQDYGQSIDNYTSVATALTDARSKGGLIWIPRKSKTFADTTITTTATDSVMFIDLRNGRFLLQSSIDIPFTVLSDVGTPLWQFQTNDPGPFGGTIDLKLSSASPINTDMLGAVRFSGNDGAGNNAVYGFMGVISSDTSRTSENGKWFFILQVDGTLDTTLVLQDNALYKKEMASASADYPAWGQLWVENTTPNQLIFTNDAGTDFVITGGGVAAAVDSTWIRIKTDSVQSTTASGDLRIISDDNVEIVIDADTDAGEFVVHEGSVTAANILFRITETTTSQFTFGGTNNPVNTVQYFVSGTNPAYTFTDEAVNLSTGRFGIGIAPASGYPFHVNSSSASPVWQFETNDAGAFGGSLRLFHDSSTPINTDMLGAFEWRGNDGAGDESSYAFFAGISADTTRTLEGGKVALLVANRATLDTLMIWNGADSSITVNPEGKDYDFTIKSDINANAFKLIGSSSFVGINKDLPETSLHVALDDAINTSTTNVLILEHTTSGTPASAIGVGLSFKVEDAGGSEQQGSIGVALTTVTNGSEIADFTFRAQGAVSAGTVDTFMKWDGSIKGLIVTGEIGMNAVQTITLGSGVTTFAVTRNYVIVTGHGSGNTIGTITGATIGFPYVFEFVDALVTITDTNDVGGANAVDLSTTVAPSADDLTLTLVHNGVNWKEIASSAN